MNDQASRMCPFCVEAIKAEAKLCPHCRQWLSIRSIRHPLVNACVVGVPVLVVMVAIGMAFIAKWDQIWNAKPYYSEFSGSLKVVESRMNWAQAREGLRIFITGVLTNRSSVAWKDVEFDCRFFDGKGVLVDASNGYGRFTINPNDDLAFRVSVAPTTLTNDYDSFRILVSTARNGKSGF